ncbi:DUF420 domain-containing protein [Akkermansiaceae bacterium]|nr:DUF420 domain-containing protein [Akkermansiaceae bacterium]MDA7888192.1 DUF420 domain-containing protein [Akkermansiaceae bacterium]
MSDREEFVSRPVLEERSKSLKRLIWIVSVLVLLLVVMMRSPYKIPLPEGVELTFLPPLHALLNTLVAACLLGGLFFLARKNFKAHQRCMMGALVLSGLFLLCYVAYHFTTVETKFGDLDGNGVLSDEEKEYVGTSRTVYLAILIPHIVVAAMSFPFILLTFVHAWTNNFAKHKKLARIVFPLWLFVAVTGPICYYMLKPFYPWEVPANEMVLPE